MTSQTKKITAPVEGLNGLGVGGLQFVDSVAYTDNEAIIAYCETSGYSVEDSDNESGTAIRDAAINPQPGDHLPPTNAGDADPAGPAVVSPALDGHTPPHEGDDDPNVAVLERPAGNASRDEWAAYVTALGDDPGDRGRDELRDAYSGQD